MPRRPLGPPPTTPEGKPDRVALARRALLEGVGAEVAASFPGITRLGGQIVAALYLSDAPQSMDALAAELGCSKSNIFGNLRGLETAGIVERRRETGARHDSYALCGPYPDVIIGAYMSRLRRMVADKVGLAERSLELLGDAEGTDADALRKRLVDLRRKYRLFGEIFSKVLPTFEGPIDLEKLLSRVPSAVFSAIAGLAKDTLRGPKKP